MSIDTSPAVLRALTLTLVPLLSVISADAKPLPRIDIVAYCRSIQAINVLPGNAEQKYEGCLSYEQRYIKDLKVRWELLSKKEQGQCVRYEDISNGYGGLFLCVAEIMQHRNAARINAELRAKREADRMKTTRSGS